MYSQEYGICLLTSRVTDVTLKVKYLLHFEKGGSLVVNPIVIDVIKIEEAAFEIVRNQGLEMLTARNIAKYIGCSTKPIYRVYENMEELENKTVCVIVEFMGSFIQNYHKTGKPLLDIGLGYINFVKSEKNLFSLISTTRINEKIGIDDNNQEFHRLLAIELKGKGFSQEKLLEIAEQILTYTYGLAMMLYLDIRHWTEDELADKLIKFFANISNSN